MILRHITLVENLQSIIKDGCLDARYSRRKSVDKGYIALEEYKGNDVMLDIAVLAKSGAGKKFTRDSFFSLYFDSIQMEHDGIVLVTDGIRITKRENEFWKLSSTDYDAIGEYRFIYGQLSLNYLTCESRKALDHMQRRLTEI